VAARAAIAPSDLPDVAARAGVSVSYLQQLLETQQDIAYDRASRAVLYTCNHGVDDGGDGGDGGHTHDHGVQPPPTPTPAAATTLKPFDVGALPPSSSAEGLPAAASGLSSSRTSSQAQVSAPRAAVAGYFDLTASSVPRNDTNAPSALPGGPDPDPAMAFKLHSRPGAPRRILLDFDGHVVTSGAWRGALTPPYSTDADPAFSDDDLLSIGAIWRSVAEDFAAWEVDVTTDDDGQDLSGWGVRVAIGGTCSGVLGGSCGWGGVAYLSSFGKPSWQPALVFSERLATAKKTAEATSHEIG